jgi:hypothetical protein
MHLLNLQWLGSLTIVAVLAVPGRTDFVIVPNDLAEIEGSGANATPFGTGAISDPTQRLQQVYAASQFASPGGPILISQISFRPDGVRLPFSYVVPDIQINLSTTSAAPDALSTTFADNIGQDDTVVWPRGPLKFSTAATGPAEGPKDFDITVNLTTAFRYDPAAGNLLLDVRRYAETGGQSFIDSVVVMGDSISRVQTTAMVPEGIASPVGRITTGGVITQFTVIAVPEPTAFASLWSGVFVLLFKRPKRCR